LRRSRRFFDPIFLRRLGFAIALLSYVFPFRSAADYIGPERIVERRS